MIYLNSIEYTSLAIQHLNREENKNRYREYTNQKFEKLKNERETTEETLLGCRISI